ncbi:hypothetical protein BSHJ18_00012 [Bacillus velezensis]|nr:hypothetical protein BSHJ18_00012 [Bacillus velezensis]
MVGYNPAPQQTIVQNDNVEEIKLLKEQNETLNTKLDAMITLLTRLLARIIITMWTVEKWTRCQLIGMLGRHFIME